MPPITALSPAKCSWTNTRFAGHSTKFTGNGTPQTMHRVQCGSTTKSHFRRTSRSGSVPNTQDTREPSSSIGGKPALPNGCPFRTARPRQFGLPARDILPRQRRSQSARPRARSSKPSRSMSSVHVPNVSLAMTRRRSTCPATTRMLKTLIRTKFRSERANKCDNSQKTGKAYL